MKHQAIIQKRAKLIGAGLSAEEANAFMGISDLEAWGAKAKAEVESDPQGYLQKARLLEVLPQVKEALGV